ncbi:hypothetical protein FPZ42_06885 [Mucilaginibacter achroorhodeus]|uniref:Uncharacterized protein n=1 Tax=Mucilaginibacter achroorhodeus TaxID=2599294 RepID=A0A563U5W9_9SPHI|nr:hypothetical protein [Mucilaginibacter achroorhodeus]TWR26756.1 hypothetical protein FPZ42_06885 [Mucilaginibacter achroorhodeus]
MKKKAILRNLLMAVSLCGFISTLTSCGKKDANENPPSNGGRTAKFTVTATGAPESAYLSFVVVGLTNNPSDATVWKVNGIVQNNQSTVSLGKNDFSGNTNTYVIESVKPLSNISVGIQCLSPGNEAYKVSYKAEVNGEVKEDINGFTVTKSADLTKDYTY